MTKHAILSASSAHRWLVCTPSALLEKQFEDEGSHAAAEGTLAHEICEHKVHLNLIEDMKKAAYTRKMNTIKKDELYDPEMEDHTDFYLNYIRSILTNYTEKPFLAVEKRVDFSNVVPEGFGTCDCILIHEHDMHIVDFKYGKGVLVSAENNPQLRLYALGAYLEYDMLFDIKTVTMHIVQPRLDSVTKDTLTADELLNWAEEVKPIAERAMNGEGDFAPSTDTCRFCRARATCRARAEKNLELAQFDFKDPQLLSDTEIGSVLQKAKDIHSWVSDVEEFALKRCLEGKSIPGYKAVEGRSNRAFSDQDAAFETLIANGIDESLLYERKPLTLSKAEKVVGKKEFAEIVGDYIIKPAGKPTLVPESDKRAPINSNEAAKEDFKEE